MLKHLIHILIDESSIHFIKEWLKSEYERIIFLVAVISYVIIRYLFSGKKEVKKTAKYPIIGSKYNGNLTVLPKPMPPAHIEEAHKALQRIVGNKGFVSARQYRKLIEGNKNIATGIIDEDGLLVGYFDVFPLTNDFGKNFVSKNYTERYMTKQCVHNPDTASESNYIYLGAMFNLVDINISEPGKYYKVTKKLNEEMAKIILELYPPDERISRKYLALAAPKLADEKQSLMRSDISKKLINMGFYAYNSKKDRRDRSILYILENKENIQKALLYIKGRLPSLRHLIDKHLT